MGSVTNVVLMIERDSRKDEAVVIIFIVATGGLLAWAVLRPWVQGWVEVSLMLESKSRKWNVVG
jgi:hypothetical protein